MRQRLSVSLSTALLALAISIVLVGTVWAGSSAMNSLPIIGSSDSTVPVNPDDSIPDDEDDSSNDDSRDAASNDITSADLLELIDELDQRVEVLSEHDQKQTQLISELTSNLKDVSSRVAGLAEKVNAFPVKLVYQLADDVERIDSALEQAVNRIVVIEGRVSNLTTDGVYTGTINPNQLSRKLTAVDLNGEWPLDRVSGELNINQLKTDSSSCMSDYRNNAFFAFDVFRRPTCIKIAK